MAQNYFFKDRTGAQNGPVSFEELANIARSGRITRDCLVWAEGGEPVQAGRLPGLAEVFGGSSPSAAATDQGRLTATFSGWDLIWRLYVFMFGLATLVLAPLAGRWFFRFLASRIALPNGRKMLLDAPLSSCWWIFLSLGAFMIAPAVILFVYFGKLHGAPPDPQALANVAQQVWPLRLAAQVAGFIINFIIVGWFVRSLRSDDGALNVIFTGGFLPFIGWDLLIILSMITVVGWAWALKGKLSWLCRRVEGSHAFEFVASGWEILWRTAVAFIGLAFVFGMQIGLVAVLQETGHGRAAAALGLPGLLIGLLIVSIVLRWLVNWFVAQIVVTPRTAEAAQPLAT